ncbi:endonuclease 4 [subsurface metagenome]
MILIKIVVQGYDAESEISFNGGSRVDRHTHIGQGKIGKESFGFFINDDRFKDMPGILETPKGKDDKLDIMNIDLLKKLRKA